MGCNSSKSAGTCNSQHELQGTLTSVVPCEIRGTTALAFITRDGIILAIDSRLTRAVKLSDGKIIKYIKEDDCPKMYPVSDKIIALVVGDVKALKELCRHLYNQFAGLMEPTVSDVVTVATDYLQSRCDTDEEDDNYGVIIGGWDEYSGYQIHRIQRDNGYVLHEKKLSGSTVLGSGQLYSNQVLSHTGNDYGNCKYDYRMSVDRGVQLAVNALFNATYYDSGTGGIIRVYHLNEESGWTTKCWKDPLEAYSNLYHVYDEKRTLYLIVSPFGSHPVATKLLMKRFRDYKILFAHCVAHVDLDNESVSLSFHRLNFRSRDDAERAYEDTIFTDHATTDPQLQSHFNRQVEFPEKPEVKLYVNWKSRELLESIRDKFEGYLGLNIDNDRTFDIFQ